MLANIKVAGYLYYKNKYKNILSKQMSSVEKYIHEQTGQIR